MYGVHIVGTLVTVTHSLVVDGTLLFGEATIQEAKLIECTLDLYTSILGQKVNLHKSKIFFFNTSFLISNKIVNILGFPIDHLPTCYLAIPFLVGTNITCYWATIIERLKSRILAWNAR